MDSSSLEFGPDFYRKILEKSPYGYVIFKPVHEEKALVDFEIIYFTPGLLEYTGFRSENLQVGLRLFEIYPVREQYLPVLQRVIDRGRPYFETHYYYPARAWIRVVAVPFREAELMLVLEDITPSMSQAQLLETIVSESLLPLLLLRAVRDYAGLVTDFTVLMTNPANARYVNRTPQEMIGCRWADVFPDVHTTGLFQRAVETTETGRSQRFTLPYQNGDERIWMDILMVKQDDGVLLTFSDVSASIRYQQQLVNMNQALEMSNDNIHQFASVASHDLQEPLRKIKAFSDILLSQYGDRMDEEGVGLVNRLQHAVTRMHALVSDLLAYSRLTTRPANMRSIDLNKLAEEVISDAAASIRKSGAEVQLDKLPRVKGDMRQLYQLLDNLLNNALKFHQPGKPPVVHIRGEVVNRPVVEPGAFPSEEKAYAKIDFIDKGIGIDDRHLERIFGMFQRLHGAEKYPGTGVGLALCKKIVENHKGLLTVKSLPGEQTTFTVYLPLD